MTEAEVAVLRETLAPNIEAVSRAVVDPAVAPIVDVPADPVLIGNLMFTKQSVALPETPVALLKPPAETAAYRTITRKARFGLSEDGTPLPGMTASPLASPTSSARAGM